MNGAQVACEFWRKNYRGRYYATSRFDDEGREEEMRKDGGDLRLHSPESGESTYVSMSRGFPRNKLSLDNLMSGRCVLHDFALTGETKRERHRNLST